MPQAETTPPAPFGTSANLRPAAALVRDQMSRLVPEGASVFEAQHYWRDGSGFPVERSSRLVKVNGALFVHSLVRDITERQRMMQELTLTSSR